MEPENAACGTPAEWFQTVYKALHPTWHPEAVTALKRIELLMKRSGV